MTHEPQKQRPLEYQSPAARPAGAGVVADFLGLTFLLAGVPLVACAVAILLTVGLWTARDLSLAIAMLLVGATLCIGSALLGGSRLRR